MQKHENFPLWIVLISNLLSVSIYILGLLILSKLGLLIAIIYLVFVLLFEFRIIRYHCINCYYWGKICGFGKGRISSWLFKRGAPEEFCKKTMSWKDMIPDMMISLIPIVTGIILLIIKFEWIILISISLIIVLTFWGNGFVRGKLTCGNCKQMELGCPAYELFNKTSNK